MALTDTDLLKIEQLLDRKLDTRFDEFEKRMDEKLDTRFAEFEKRMDEKFDTRFAEFEKRMDEKFDTRFAEFEKKMDEKLDTRFVEFEKRMDEKLDTRFAEFEKKQSKTYVTKNEFNDGITRLEKLIYFFMGDVNERLAQMQKELNETNKKLSTLQDIVMEIKDVMDKEYTIALYKELPDHKKRISRIEEKLALPALADSNESLEYKRLLYQREEHIGLSSEEKEKKILEFRREYKKYLKRAKLDRQNQEKVDKILAEKNALRLSKKVKPN